jgi:alpha-galactosidase
MPKIVMIGAGSAGFCRLLVQDILYCDALKESDIVLVDIDEKRLNTTFKVMQNMKQQHNLKCRFSATTDRRKALRKADFAISMIQVGGLEPYKLDISIPLKYGIDQCVGDTLNPGGIFRGLRHVPVLLDMLKDMEDVSPDIIFMNYANPMAICSWAMQISYPDIISVGLCHGVQHTTNMLCKWLNVPVEECDVLSAGINHMAWFLKLLHNGKNLYHTIWHKLETEGPIKGEEYRFEMMKATGFFMTEAPDTFPNMYHISENVRIFRSYLEDRDFLVRPERTSRCARKV